MNRSPALLCLPFLVSAALAQQEPFLVQTSRQALVRMAPNEVALNVPLLNAIAESAEVRQAVAKALGKRLADPSKCTVDARDVTAPQPSGVFQFSLVLTATITSVLDAAAEDAAMQAAAEVLRQRLEAMLIDGPRRDLKARATELEARLQQAEAQREEVSVRLLQLGGEDAAEAQKLLGELQRRRLDVELDLRTEEAMQARLQKLVEAARRGLADAGARVAAVAGEAGRLAINLAERRKVMENLAGDSPAVQALQKQLADSEARAQDLQLQRAAATDAAEAEARLVHELTAQATAATIALNRHASRLQVLQAAIQQQEKRAAEALARAVERGKVEQMARRGDDTIAMLRTRLNVVTLRIESLEPIRVELWR